MKQWYKSTTRSEVCDCRNGMSVKFGEEGDVDEG